MSCLLIISMRSGKYFPSNVLHSSISNTDVVHFSCYIAFLSAFTDMLMCGAVMWCAPVSGHVLMCQVVLLVTLHYAAACCVALLPR